MSIGPIDPLASVSYTVNVGNLSWTSAADWDAAVSETGVVHENVSGTDHTDASTVKMGYSYDSPLFSSNLVLNWPLDDVSGSTATDYSGTSNDGTINGSPADGTGILGTSSPDLDGTDDYIQAGGSATTNEAFTAAGWVNMDVASECVILNERNQSGNDWLLYHESSGKPRLFVFHSGGAVNATSPTAVSTNTWYFIVGVYDGSDVIIYVDAVEEDRASQPNTRNKQGIPTRAGYDTFGYHDGNLENPMVFDRALSASEVQTLYDVVDAESSLTSATKSFGSPQQPDLANLSYNLNGESITIDVIGSPSGTSETVSQTLDGSTSYTLTWSSSHTDFRVKPRLSTTDPTTTPTISTIELTQ